MKEIANAIMPTIRKRIAFATVSNSLKSKIINFTQTKAANTNPHMRYILSFLKNPITMYQIKEEKFDNLFERLINSYKKNISDNKNKLLLITNNLNNGIVNNLNNNKNRYLTAISKLEVLNPLNTIKRGYSITKKSGKVITSTKDVKRNDNLQLELSDGTIDVEVL